MSAPSASQLRSPAIGYWLLVERVAASELFGRSPRLKQFFLYVARCTLEDRLADAREQIIADRVFGRRCDLSSQDSIVRAEARNLRKRLDLYFETEGRAEPVLITMPKGAYALAFEPRLRLMSEPAPAVPPAPLTTSRRPVLAFVVAAAALVAALVLYWVLAGSHRLALPLSALFEGQTRVIIVTSDVGFLQIANLTHHEISLDDYISRSYPANLRTQPPDLIRNWNLYEFTDSREMFLAGLFLQQHPHYASRMFLRSGHSVQLRDFRENNAILIGSAVSNPWAQLFQDRLNFRASMIDGRIVFRAASPAAGPSYPSDDDLIHHRAYSQIAFLPRSSDSGATLLLAGTTAQATQAAGEFLANPAALSGALQRLHLSLTGKPRFFEIFLRTSEFVGGAIQTEIVACRLQPAIR